MGTYKYTKEQIAVLVKGCTTVADGLKKLGLNPRSGSNPQRTIIKEVLIEQGTFKGRAHSKNKGIPRISNDEFFTHVKRKSWAVRNALFKRGIKEKKCEECGNTHWEGHEIPLECHHIDGNKNNNTLSNLKILCPNCHYFTDNYKGKNNKNI